jgi:hypothetical protein
MDEITTIRLERATGEGSWRWRAVTGRRGESHVPVQGLEPGDELVVALRWTRAAWHVVRVVRYPDHAWEPVAAPVEAPAVTLDGVAPREVPGSVVRPGDVRRAEARINPRTTAERDAGITAKRRPAVVSWVGDDGHVGLHFVYDVDSAVRREGLGRRLADWRAAGLRKPSVVALAEEVRRVEDLGGFIGRLSPGDRSALGIGAGPGRPHRS